MKHHSRFHPAIEEWFAEAFGDATEPQALAWPLVQAGKNVLIAAPTGSGKTLAAFLAAIDELTRQGLDAPLPDETTVLYVSPLGFPMMSSATSRRHWPVYARNFSPSAWTSTFELVRTGDTPDKSVS
jgi:hypothetical protein